MKALFIWFAGGESGVTAIEYGLIAALISIGIISAVTVIGTTLRDPDSRRPTIRGGSSAPPARPTPTKPGDHLGLARTIVWNGF